MQKERIGRYETFSKQNERTVVMNYLRNELGENADNLYVLYNDIERGMCLDRLKDVKAYVLQELISSDRCYLLRRRDALSDTVATGVWCELDECANAGVYCSKCGKKIFKRDFSDTMKWKDFNFCPKCGSRNVRKMGSDE